MIDKGLFTKYVRVFCSSFNNYSLVLFWCTLLTGKKHGLKKLICFKILHDYGVTFTVHT